MFKCDICGAVFDRPRIHEGYDPMPDCNYERFKQVLCPVCGQPYFNEIEEDSINGNDENPDGEHEP